MRTVLIYLGCVRTLLIVFVILIFFAILVVSQGILTFLNLIVQVKISITRSYFILVQLVLKVNSLWFESRLLLLLFRFFWFNNFLFQLFLFCSKLFFGVKVRNDIKFSASDNILSVFFDSLFCDLFWSLGELGRSGNVDNYFFDSFFLV
jgi:hypothetical protein